jgi:TPR repeat protein
MSLMITAAHADDKKLFEQLLSLSKQGDAIAQYNLGMFYNNGIGTSRNSKAAFEWFQKSAANNNPLGAYKVGCYYSGQGQEFMPVDHAKALEYKLVAAKAGYTLAQSDVAGILLSSKNVAEGIKWLKSAGDQGDFNSLATLFGLYYKGNKIPKDLPSAYLYLNLAMKVATDEPPEKIKTIMKELIKSIPQTEREKIDSFISKWEPKPSDLTIEAKRGMSGVEEYLNLDSTHKRNSSSHATFQ